MVTILATGTKFDEKPILKPNNGIFYRSDEINVIHVTKTKDALISHPKI